RPGNAGVRAGAGTRLRRRLSSAATWQPGLGDSQMVDEARAARGGTPPWHRLVTANIPPMNNQPPDSQGLLVLGMHRSGTSALARVLGLCGADLGSRVASAGAGNETGHWEDSFAVELHDRLLSQFGATWDSPFALPRGWLDSAQGAEAVAGIAGYLRGNRALHPLWASKDPRLCLFAPAWTRAADEAGMPLAAVMVLRDPAEVAGSLAARDGIARGRGLL